VLVFLVVLLRAQRRPTRPAIAMALFFGAIALDIVLQLAARAAGLHAPRLLGSAISAVLMVLPYLLLRLAADFSRVPRWLLRIAEAGLVISVGGLLILTASAIPTWFILFCVIYFVALTLYASACFVQEARHSHGVTCRRMQAVAAGSLFLGLVLLVAGLQAFLPAASSLWNPLSRTLGLASGLAYFLGFAPPSWLRRAWQEPELREFLTRAASLPRLPETKEIVAQLESGAASIVGAPQAVIGLWDANEHLLHYGPDTTQVYEPHRFIGGRAFSEGRAIFSADAERDDPENAQVYQSAGATAILAAPISAGTTRLGVLVAYAPRAPIFAEDDLELVQLLADQAAVILESRALIDEAAMVKGREEAARLKDDFLSSAAHDLKTPLTTLMAQAQLLERRALLRPEAPTDVSGLQRLVRESKRLNRLVLELLDASRLEAVSFAAHRERVNLVQLATEVSEEQTTERHPCVVVSKEAVFGCYDSVRIKQLIENLIENGVKYSPAGGEVLTSIGIENDEARMTVSDHGIGIPETDLPRIFSRFHRGTNVDDRRFAGMGLGLFICRSIVEQHGGRIWATSRTGEGSSFHVALPLNEGECTE
jgi:signal transduction histidine kinase